MAKTPKEVPEDEGEDVVLDQVTIDTNDAVSADPDFNKKFDLRDEADEMADRIEASKQPKVEEPTKPQPAETQATIDSIDQMLDQFSEQLGSETVNKLREEHQKAPIEAEAAKRMMDDPRARAAWEAHNRPFQPAAQDTTSSEQAARQSETVNLDAELTAFNTAMDAGDAAATKVALSQLLERQGQLVETRVTGAVNQALQNMGSQIQQDKVNDNWQRFLDQHPDVKENPRVYDTMCNLIQTGEVASYDAAYDLARMRLELLQTQTKEPEPVDKKTAMAAAQVAKTGRSAQPQAVPVGGIEEAYDRAIDTLRNERGW